MTNPVTSAMLELAKIKERSAERSGGRLSGAYTLILFALVILALMVALLFGTTVYGAVNSARVSDDESRVALNVVANAVRQVDSANSVKSSAGPEGEALVLLEQTGNGVYETRFFLYGGALMQEYARADRPIDPSNAVVIADTGTFNFDFDGNSVTVTTDQGEMKVTLRSAVSLSPYPAEIAENEEEGAADNGETLEGEGGDSALDNEDGTQQESELIFSNEGQQGLQDDSEGDENA